jgi:hypothetical protein
VIEQERQRRKEMWEELIAQGGPKDVSPHLLRELRIYGGYQGIWVDREKTEGLTNSGLGVTIGLLHTGGHYPDGSKRDRNYLSLPPDKLTPVSR